MQFRYSSATVDINGNIKWQFYQNRCRPNPRTTELQQVARIMLILFEFALFGVIRYRLVYLYPPEAPLRKMDYLR